MIKPINQLMSPDFCTLFFSKMYSISNIEFKVDICYSFEVKVPTKTERKKLSRVNIIKGQSLKK